MTAEPVTPTVVLTVELAGFPPLPNALRRLHWAARADSNRTWRGAAYLMATQALREAPNPEDFPLQRATLRVTHVRPGGTDPDPDNVLGAVKPVVDGMVDAKVLQSDRRSCVQFLPVEYSTGPLGLRVDVVYGAAR